MSYRLLTYSVDDIALEPETVAKNLTLACRRQNGVYQITGLCQTNDRVFFPMEMNGAHAPARYVLAPMQTDRAEDIAARLHTRWRAGFRTLGLVRVGDGYYGLFATDATEE